MKKRVLAIASNPINTPRLDLDSEIRDLQEAFQRSQHRDRFVFEWRIVKTYEDFRRCILDVKPNIIHFCGHGTKEGLVLADDQYHAKLAGNEVLADFLKLYADRIECFLLNACDTQPLADALVQHLNYVVGMNQPVYDDAAKAFAQSFYDGIGAGDSYETAFEIGRNAVLNKRYGAGRTFKVVNRKLFAVEQDGEQVEIENQEHLIPIIKVNSNPTPIKPLWLDPEVERQAVRDLLKAIENGFNTIQLFHTNEPIVLKDQYIPVQVTLERRYKHAVETIGGYAESEAELRQIYAMKGSSEEKIEKEIKRQQVDWEEVRRQHSRIIVLADPGMGKSTLLRREVVTSVQQAYQALTEGKPVNDITIPLFIRLSSLADEVEKMPTGEAILKIIQERHFTLLKEHENAEVVTFLNAFLKKQLLNGKALLLLDALDEVPDGKRQKLLEKLNEFAKDNQTNPCPIVGTSRIVGYGGRFVDGAKDVEIVPFTQKQTEHYIETWFTNAQKSLKDQSISASGLIKALRERPQLAGLAQNPLLLSLICSLYQRNQLTLPARRSQIYEQAVNCMLGEWNQTRPDFDDDRTTAKIRLLEELAYYFTSEGQEVFDYEDLYNWVESYLEDGDAPRDLRDAKTGELIAELSEEDGILQKLYRDKSDDQYLFLHRTFQEYFTASYLKRSLKKNKKNPAYVTELVRKYCWDYDWHETLTLLAGLMENPIMLIEAIDAEKDDIFQTQLLLEGRCVAECSQISAPIIDNLIDRIYQFWLAYPGAEFIRSVVVAIGQTQPKIAEKLSQVLLNHENDSVRQNAEVMIERISKDKGYDPLSISILSKEDTYISNTSKAVSEQSINDKAVNALIEALNSENSDVSWKAATALGEIGDDRAVDALIEALNSKNSDVRSNAAEPLNYAAALGLGQIDSDKSINILIKALRDENENVRINMAIALGKIGNNKAVDALIKALDDKNSQVRVRAAAALGEIGDNKAVSALIRALNEDDAVVAPAAVALGQIANDKAVDALIDALNNGIVGYAAVVLAQISNSKAVDALIEALNSENSDLKWLAASEFRQIDPLKLSQLSINKAVTALINALNDKNSDVRRYAAEMLGKIGDNKAVSALISSLKDENSYVREKAAKSLGQIGNDNAVDALIEALSDWDDSVGLSAAAALWQIDSVVCLKKLLQSSDPNLIYRSDMFPLARRCAIRFSKTGLPFIPVYPKHLPKADNNPD